jgi:hypothetical protein
MSYRSSIYDHQFHIRPEATTAFGETIAVYLAQYFDLHPPPRGGHPKDRLELKQSAAHQTWSDARNLRTRGVFDIAGRTGFATGSSLL